MRTNYDKTSNIIDLAQLRRRRNPAQFDNLVRQTEEERESPTFRPAVLITTPEERRRARRERFAWRLDICASLAVILMTVVFALRVLL